jgi:chemotaxis protein MotB
MAKSGGAWKVAYADFVTAMMAFFLVMWICGQDQTIRRSVSYYFMDPFGSSRIGLSKKAMKAGGISEYSSGGSVPESERTALGRGRNPYLESGEASAATKCISEWVFENKGDHAYWQEQAARCRKRAGLTGARSASDAESRLAQQLATRELAQQLRDEVTSSIPPQVDGVYRQLLVEVLKSVNWKEVAQDLLVQ